MSKFLICLPWCIPLMMYEGNDYGTAFMLLFGAAIGAAITAEIFGVDL